MDNGGDFLADPAVSGGMGSDMGMGVVPDMGVAPNSTVVPDTGFFSGPAAYTGLGPIDTNTQFSNPFADIAPPVTPRGASNEDPLGAMLERELRKPSFMAQTAPQFFDWDANNTDRYINSEYYKELGFNPNRDNETLYGNRQTFGDTMQQAFAGAGELAWDTFWDGWKGWGRLVDSLVHWDASRIMGTPEELEALSKEQNRVMNKYAIFRTPESEGSIFNKQFLGDMIQQSGFAVGTMAQFAAEELLTMGAATLFKGGTTALKLSNLLKWAKTGEVAVDMKEMNDVVWKSKAAERLFNGLNKASDVTKFLPVAGSVVDSGLNIWKAAKKGATGLELTGMTLNGFRRLFSESNMAFTESRMEAAGTYAELKDKLIADTQQQKGEVGPEDLQRIEQHAQAAAWSNFKVNAGVISLMNRFEYDNLVRTFGSEKRAMREMVESGEEAARRLIDPKRFQSVTGKAAKDITNEAGKVTVKAGDEFTQVYSKGVTGTLGNVKKIAADFGRKQAAWEATKSVGGALFKWEVDEGLQELVQEGSNIAIQHYYEDLYLDRKGDKGYNDYYVDKAIGELMNTNGLKVFLMGAVTGRLLSPIEKGISFGRDYLLGNRKEKQQEVDKSVSDINQFFRNVQGQVGESLKKTVEEYYSDPAHYAPEGVANLRVQHRAAEVMKEAVKNNDKYLYEHAKDGAFAKAVIAAKKLNMLESLTSTIRAYGDHFDETGFREAFNVDFKEGSDRATVKEYMNKLAGNIENFSKRVDALREKYSDVVRPEKYVGEDQETMRRRSRALDEMIEWVAVSEYRAQQAHKRGLSIIQAAAQLDSIKESAHLAFSVLGDDEQMGAEIGLLKEEVAGLESGEQTEDVKRQLEVKRGQLEALQEFQKLAEPYKHTSKDSPVAKEDMNPHEAGLLMDHMENMLGALKKYVNGVNKSGGLKQEVTEADAQDFFFLLNDYRKLDKFYRKLMNVNAFLSNPTNFQSTFDRTLLALDHLRNKKIEETLNSLDNSAAKKGATSTKDKDQNLTAEQVREGKLVKSYHGFRVGDKVRDTKTDSTYSILQLTTKGVEWLDKEAGTKHTMGLDRFDRLVAENRLERTPGKQKFKVVFQPGEKRTADDGVEGVFIVEDKSQEKTFYRVVNADNVALDREGTIVPEGEEPEVYSTEEEAKQVRDGIVEAQEKAQKELEEPFVFDGKEMKHGTVLVKSGVGSQESGGKKERFIVVSKGAGSPESESPEFKAKKAEIEEDRKAALKPYDERDERSLQSVMPNNPNHPIVKVGSGWDDGLRSAIIENTHESPGFDGRPNAYTAVTKVLEPATVGADDKLIKAAKVEVTHFNTKKDADKFLEEQYEKVKEKAGKKQKEINAEYDAKLEKLKEELGAGNQESGAGSQAGGAPGGGPSLKARDDKQRDSIELEPLGGGETFTIDSMDGYELATEAALRRPAQAQAQKEGAFRLRAVNELVSASGVPQGDEDQAEADARLQEVIRSTPPKDLEEGLVIRIRNNDADREPRLAKEDTDQENPSLLEQEGPLVVELVYNDEVIGTLPYFDRYVYMDENRAQHKMDALKLEQFEEVFDTEGKDVAAAYDAFTFYYKEAEKVFKELEDRVRDDKAVDIKGADLQSLFRVISFGGATEVVPEAQQALDGLAYTGVNGKRVVLVQSLERDSRNLESRTNLVLVEGGLPPEDQKKLEERIKEARTRDGRDLANGLGEYVAVVELPNGELRFVPLDVKGMTADELNALAARLNAQSEQTIKDNWTEKGADDPNFLGSYNGSFNGGLLDEFFISVPGQQTAAWIDLSLGPSGAVTVNFQNPHTSDIQAVVIDGGAEGKPVSFTNFSDFLLKVNKAIAEHDAKAKPADRIGLQLKAEHFKKHLAPLKELTAKDGHQQVDFKAVGQLPAFVTEEVVGPASLMVTSKSAVSDALSVLLEHEARNQAEEAAEEDEDDEEGEKPAAGKGAAGEKKPKGGGNKKKGSKSPKKVKAVVRRIGKENTNKGAGGNQGAKKNDPKALGRELKRLEKEVERLTNLYRTEALAEAKKKQEETAVNGKKAPLNFKAIQEAGSNHPEVLALKKRIREIEEQNKQNKGNAAAKVLTQKELEKADVEDIERFRQWMQDNLPDYIGREEVDLIAQNMNRYGINVGRLIYRLKELGKPGIEAKIEIDVKAPFKYHEAFHTVFRLLLSDEEIDKYLAIARTEVTAKLRKEGKTLAGELRELRKLVDDYHLELTKRKLTDKELESLYYEEYLADRFDAWKMDATKEKEGWLNQLFRRIYTFVRNIVKKFTPGELELLFMKMDSGAYKQAAIVDNRYTTDPNLAAAPQVALKSIKVGEQLITDEDGNDVWVGEYLSQAKATGLASSIAGTYYARMLERKAAIPTVDPEAETDQDALRTSVADQVLDGVMKDYAKLYDKDNLQYLELLGDEETIGQYYTVAAELDKLKTLLEEKPEVIREAVQQHLQTIALMRSEEEEEADDVNDENGDQAMVDWHQNKESMGGFDSLSEWVRQYISTTTYVGKDAFGNTELREGEPLLQAVDASRVYSGILKMAAGLDEHQLLLRMQTIAQQNQYGYASEHCAHFIKRFFSDMGLVVTPEGYEMQKKEKAYLFNAVIKGFQKHAVDYLLFNKDLHTNNTNIIASNRYESKRKQFSTWFNAFNHLFYERYKRTSEARKAAFFESRVKGLRELERLMRIGKLSQETVEQKSVEISQLLKEGLGLHLHPLYIQSCLLETILEGELEPPQLTLLRELPEVALLGLHDVEMLLLEIERGKNPFVWNKDATDVEGYKANERSEGQALATHLMNVAEANALYDESVNVTSFKNANLETVYGHQLPTFHLVRVSELSRQLGQPGQVAKGDAYLAGNLLANSADMQQMAADLKVARVNGMNSYSSDDSDLDPYYSGYNQMGVTYGDFKDREMLLTLFELYGVSQLYYRPDGKTRFRSSRHLVRVLEASNTGDTVNLPIIRAIEQKGEDLELSAKAVNAMVQEVKREFDRIRQVKQEREQIAEEKRTGKRVTKEIEGYHNGATPRGLTLFKTGGMLGALAKELEKEAQGDRPQFRDFEERLKKQLQTYWMGKGGQLDQTIALMKELGIVEEKNGKLENVLLPSFMSKKRNDAFRNEELIGQLELTKDNLLHNIAQVLVNDFLNTQSFNQLLLGDQAVSLESFIDMVKRAKGANGSGPSTYFEVTAPEMGIKNDGRKSHVVHIDDPMFWGKYANKMHRKADGQMWMTVKFLRYTLFGLGRLTPIRAALLDKLERGEAVDVDEIFGAGGTIAMGGQNNPLKLVYYDGKRYIKISSFVLTRELTSVQVNGKWRARKGYEELYALQEKLEDFEERNQTTCLAVPASGSKGEKANVARGVLPYLESEGGPSLGARDDSQGTVGGDSGTVGGDANSQQRLVDPISDWNFQELDNRFWRLQTENPSNKLEITDPTQAKQLVMGEQDDSTEVWFPWSDPDKPITVGELKKIYLEDSAQRQKVKYRDARNQIFTFEEALQEIKTSADLQKVTPKLDKFLKKAVDTLRISAADSQLLEFFSVDAGGHQRFDLNHPATLNKFTQLFLAYFTKGVMNEKVPGRVYTLVSNYGMKVIRRVLEVGPDGQPKRTELVTRRQYEQNPEAYEDALEWGGDPNGTAEERQRAIDERRFFNLKERFEKNGKKPTYIVDDLRHMVPEYALEYGPDGKQRIKKDRKGNEIILGHYTEYMTAPHSREEVEYYQENGKIPDVVARAFGVRIPTDDKHSMITMKMVDYLPAHYGSSMVAAPEVVEISGADFDADKVFASTKEYYTKRALEEEDLEDPFGTKPFYHYYSRRQGEPVEFVEYGTLKDEKGRFNEYVLYQKRYNKAFKKQYQEFLQANEEYRDLQRGAHELAHKIEERLKKGTELLPKIKGKNLSMAELRDMALEADDQLIEWKQAHKEIVRQLKMIQREATLATLEELSLPTTAGDYAKKVKREGEQNIGVLNNRLVDAKIQFLANKHMMEEREKSRVKSQKSGVGSQRVNKKKADIEKRRREELSKATKEITIKSVIRPNGAIGTQGTDPTQMKNLIRFLNTELSLNIPSDLFKGDDEVLKPLIDFIKNDKNIVSKIKEYIKTNPSEITVLPDDTIEFDDGNHRANLLRIIGADTLPVIDRSEKNKINATYDTELSGLAGESNGSPAGDSSGERRRNPIAFELTSVQALKDLVEDFKVIFKDSKEIMAILEEGNVDPDTFLGKVVAFRNNKEGADNIGEAVNSMLAYMLLNMFDVQLREQTEEKKKNGEVYNRPIWRFKLNGVEFDSYSHTHAYSHTIEHADGSKEHVFEGERIMHTISALVQAMTDNAKERLAAKLGLNIEAVGLVSNLVAQGVPLSSAVSLMLQPAVREYYKLTKNLKASVKTEEEESQSKYAIGENLLNSLGEGLSKAEKETELTDDLLRDNILQNGSNKAYQYAVLNAFMKLKAQTQYFKDVSAVMKVVKGMQSSHEGDSNLEEKMDQLGLFDSDEAFDRKHIPFDLRQVLTGKNPKERHNNIVAQGIKHFKEVRELQKRVFVERTDTFQELISMIRDNLRVRWYDSAEFEKKIKQDLLSFLSIKAYKKALLEAGRLNRAMSLSPAMIFDGEAAKMPEGFKDIVDVVLAIREALPDNVFINNYLNVLPTHVENAAGEEIRNPANRSGLNKAEINTWAKLDPLQTERMQDSFMEIVSNDDTRDYAWALFHYLLVKDGGQFRNGSFIRFIPPAMFKDLLDATAQVNKVFMKGREDGKGFERVFGQQDFELMNEFVHGYLMNATNMKYLHKVDINKSTADLNYSRFTSTASVSETKTDKLSAEEQEELKRYVPETFKVSEDGSEIVVDMTGGIREGEERSGKYDNLENAKYGKNMTSLKLRGFFINNHVPYTKKKKPGEKRAQKGIRTGVEFPYILKHEIVTEQGREVLLYRLAEVDFREEENHKHRKGIDPTYFFGVGGTKSMGTHARYVLAGRPNGHSKVWGGIFMYGALDTRAFPRERGFYGNYGGYDVDDAPDSSVFDDPQERKPKGQGGEDAASPLGDFMDQYGLDSIDVVDGAYVFYKGGELAPGQEELEKAFSLLLRQNQGLESEFFDSDDDDYDEDDDNEPWDDEVTSKPPDQGGSAAEENPDLDELARRMRDEGPLGC